MGHHVNRPARILVFLADLIKDSVNQHGILQNHQVSRKDEAILHPGATFGNFLYLRNFLDRLVDCLQEELFLVGKTAFRQCFFHHRDIPVDYRKNASHGKARRRRHARHHDTGGSLLASRVLR